MFFTIFALLLNFFVGVYQSKKALLEGNKCSAVLAVFNWFFVGTLSLILLREVIA
uniref:Uncharacterized protein n=1 Tax=Klebsiella phage vB_KpnM_Iguana_ER37 TaxID=3076781 RepID=A0AB38Z4A9_9CAUD